MARLASLALAVGMVVLAMPTAARTIRVDQGHPGNYALNGQAWFPETPLTPPSPLGSTLPFLINFGAPSGPTDLFCLYEDGLISFGDGTCGAIPPANATLEPLAADWQGSGATGIQDAGAITYGEGNLAPEASRPANPLDAPQAVRFTWSQVACCSGLEYSFQAILIDRGNGDFDLELNYGDFINPTIPSTVGDARFTLGPNTHFFSGPFDSQTDYGFQFRSGRLVGTQVPEPGVVPLLAIACTALAMLGWRRRMTPSRARA